MLSGVTSRSSSSPINSIDCSRERTEKVLIALGEKELTRLAEEEPVIEVCCHFCDKKYEFTKEELKELINQI